MVCQPWANDLSCRICQACPEMHESTPAPFAFAHRWQIDPHCPPNLMLNMIRLDTVSQPWANNDPANVHKGQFAHDRQIALMIKGWFANHGQMTSHITYIKPAVCQPWANRLHSESYNDTCWCAAGLTVC